MTYEEAKIETFDKLLPRLGERFRWCGGDTRTWYATAYGLEVITMRGNSLTSCIDLSQFWNFLNEGNILRV